MGPSASARSRKRAASPGTQAESRKALAEVNPVHELPAGERADVPADTVQPRLRLVFGTQVSTAHHGDMLSQNVAILCGGTLGRRKILGIFPVDMAEVGLVDIT